MSERCSICGTTTGDCASCSGTGKPPEMATASEWLRRGVKKIALRVWNPHAFIKLPKVNEDGTHGVWCLLFDTMAPKDGIPMLLMDLDKDGGWVQAENRNENDPALGHG